MTAAELAHFRSLLQSQAIPPKPPARSLFERMRGRLTLVERVDAPSPETLHLDALAAQAEPEPLTWDQVLAPAAPPPRSPPRFGRREGEAAPVLRVIEAAEPEASASEAPVILRRRVTGPDDFATPDELPPDPAFTAAEAPVSDAPSPGVIAGWSRKRPPSAQRRILTRLEAVFLAEQQGLEARRLAVDGAAVAA